MTLFELIKKEIKAIFSNPAITLTVFGGVVFYSFLYPLPYSHQTPREQPITVINLDNSLPSRQLERMVDATPQIKIVERAHTINEAKAQFFAGKVRGILFIPENFYRDLLLGKSPTLGYAGDASYFLVYGTIAEGLAKAGGTLAAKTKITQLLADGIPLDLAKDQYTQTKLNMKPTFNPTIGYVNYVVPAVFVLILQQTLIIGLGLMGATEKSNSKYWCQQPTVKILAVRTLIFIVIYYVMSLYYFGFSFDFYGISKLASPLLLLMLLVPFLLASSFIGIVLGALVPRRELVTVIVLVSSMPLVFSGGFIWPLESLPQPIIWISNLFPCTPAIQSFLSVNQMGADFSQIISQWTLLWVQVIVWGALAFMCYHRVQKKIKRINNMKTRNKIVYASLKLFNESGERNITTNHIASDLSISPGNLYYHFKNKQEIIRDIFDVYSQELLSLFSAIDGPKESLALFKKHLDSIFTLMWKYRFFYANLSQILQQDPLLHQRYLAVQEKLKRNLQLSFNEFIKLELIEIEEEELQTVITSLHLIILSWLSYQAAVSLKTKITEQVIYQGMLQMTAVLKPFTTRLGRQQLLALEEEIAKKC